MPVDAQSAHGRESAARDEQHSLGLTQAEAERRLATVGANAMPREVSRPGLRLLRKFWAPVLWMLEVAIVALPSERASRTSDARGMNN